MIILLIALGVHSCQVSATNSALQDYTNNVSSLIARSNTNGKALFTTLAQAPAAGSPTNVQNQINQTLSSEKKVLSDAKQLSVPDQVKSAHSKLQWVFQMRVDGIANIANQIQPTLASSATLAGINQLARETARFYASDVLYKDYASPEIYGAMHAAGVRFSGLDPGQFLPNVEWLVPSFIAQQLHVTVPGLAPTRVAPGLHGHSLTSVSVNGTTLQTGSTNTIPSKPIPTFTLNFANGGTNNETAVKCKVSVNGTSVTGTAVVPQTLAGKNATCQVKLNATPPTGTQTVVATVEKVPGEKNIQNNTNTYTVTFQ